jgi:hypothetical protein
MKAPFPYFGGKSKVADIVWERFGHVRNYIEPFFGSGAVMLSKPFDFERAETINDKDGLVSNFWRAVSKFPEEVAKHADWPVNEADLHARHIRLINERNSLTEKLIADPEWCDAKSAGWWVWGASAWIGRGWCSGQGPWQSVNGNLVKVKSGYGVWRQIPHLGDSGQGINKKSYHPSGTLKRENLTKIFQELQHRLRSTRVVCGGWERCVGNSVIRVGSPCAIFLDPPYSEGVEYSVGSKTVGNDVREWCKLNGDRKELRIALCGYEGHHEELEDIGWSVYSWKTRGGYGSASDGQGSKNKLRERIWFSPNCINPIKNET